jgi:hypothetical protein
VFKGRGRRLAGALALSAALLAIAASGSAAAKACLLAGSEACPPFSNLVFTAGGQVSPRALPTKKRAPVEFTAFFKVKTKDGTQPPALRQAILTIGKNIDIDLRGLPVCRGDGRDVRRRDGLRWAEKACGEAVVGRGRVGISISLPEQPPISVSSRMVLFNDGARDGAIKLNAVAEIKVPVPRSLVATIEIRRGPAHGWTVRVRTPVIAGGSGAITHFALNLARKFIYRGERKSFLSARCPDRVFKVRLPRIIFRNEAKVPGVAPQTVLKSGLAIPCTPKG